MNGEPQVGFRFTLVHPGGRHESLLVDAERALIGSAPHCEVRLPPEFAAHEHVEVYASDRIIHFSTRPNALSMRVPALGGMPTVEGRWDGAQSLALGPFMLSVSLVDLGAPKAKPPYWMLALLLPVVSIGVTALVVSGRVKRGDMDIPEAPALLPPKEASSCPNVAPEQRASLAAEKMRIGLAKRERSPFAPQDGLEAITYFDAAASCYRAVNQAAEASQADRASEALRAKLDEEYRVRRVRLEHAYRIHDPAAVKRELVVLVPMTAHHRGPYTEWLAALNRAATAEVQSGGGLL